MMKLLFFFFYKSCDKYDGHLINIPLNSVIKERHDKTQVFDFLKKNMEGFKKKKKKKSLH